jgi:hypothetical protein
MGLHETKMLLNYKRNSHKNEEATHRMEKSLPAIRLTGINTENILKN